MLKKLTLPATLFLALGLFGTACSDDDEDNQSASACKAISEVCHGIDTQLGDECHEIGHDNDADECAEREDECVTHCTDHAGAGGAGGGGGAGGSH